jgi:riboflavin kinase/FMN adenylyltransferase
MKTELKPKMEVFHTLDQIISRQPTAVTIGNFDGLHIGHQKLIHSMIQSAKTEGRDSVAITFFPHPKAYANRAGFFYLTSMDEKLELLAKMGIDRVVVLEFGRELMRVRAAEFIDLLVSNLALHDLWIGHDFRFGYQREGDVALLRQMGDILGYTVNAAAPVLLGGRPISSSRIRDALRAGDWVQANACLGYPYHETIAPIGVEPFFAKQ